MNVFQTYPFRGLAKLSLASALVISSSCSLDRDPPLNELTTIQVYENPANYPQLLAKLYGGLVLTGMGAADEFNPRDISFGDGGATSFSRALWKMQEIPADHAVVAWGDPGLPDLNIATPSPGNIFVQAMYVRIFFELGLCNEYLRQTTDSKLSDYGLNEAALNTAREYRNDARFLRALSYYYATDMFGNVPFVTEKDNVEYFQPKQLGSDFASGRRSLFDYVESELKAIENSIAATPQYGRAGRGAVRTLLSHLYLNAESWIGTPRYSEAATYAKKVIDEDGYSLCTVAAPEMSAYNQLFAADNGQNANARNEIIFPIACDGLRTQSYGGSTFLVHASTGGKFLDKEKGITGAWGGIRAKLQLPLLFGDTTTIAAGGVADQRCGFFVVNTPRPTDSHFFRVASLSSFRFGAAVKKWTNFKSTSTAAVPVRGSHPGGNFTDTDIPLMRLGELYLTYAEAVLRGGSGDRSLALGYINALRTRANAAPITDADMTLNFLLDERGRETYWEGYRRTDLIRFGKYTGGNYLWDWKGNTPTGTSIPEHLKVFPIPTSELTANPNIKQNPGY
jgi:starch-binding outer membrane protein, SusD/RagB family